MDNKEEEKIKENIENAEFNNPEEDFKNNEESEEKNEKDDKEEKFIDDGNNKKKNIIIISLAILVVLLIIIVLCFLLSGNKGDKNSNSSNNSNSNNESNNNSENNNNDNSKKTINEDDYDFSKAGIYLNKYLHIKEKDSNKSAISDLEGNIIFETTDSWVIYEEDDKSLLLLDLNYKKVGDFNIKRIKDNTLYDVFNENATGLLIGYENNKPLGVYKQGKDNETIYLINGNEYNKIELDNYVDISFGNAERESKYIYNNQYIITFDKMGQEKFENYGIYDIKSKSQLVKGYYDKIYYLHDNVFVAVKNDKAGIIDTNNNVLYSFTNEIISYSNGLYFIGNNNKLKVLDSNLKELNQEIDVPNLSKYTLDIGDGSKISLELKPFKDSVIVKLVENLNELDHYIVIHKNGTKVDLGKGKIGFVGNYLVSSNNNDTNIVMLDSNLNVAHKIDVGSKAISLDNVYIFLNNTLVINGNKLYNLDNDTFKGTTNWYRRTSQEFEVRIDFSGDKGTVTISRNEEKLKTIENVPVSYFLKAENNGITITKDKFIYNAGGVAIIERNEADVRAQENR